MRLCEHCRGEIPSTARVDARYCSATCRRGAHRDRHDQTVLTLLRRGVPESLDWQLSTRRCEHCDTPLPHELRRHAHYCSTKCRKAAAAARAREDRVREAQIAMGIPIGMAGLVRLTCAFCRATMPEGRRADARYCSVACRKRAGSERAAATSR